MNIKETGQKYSDYVIQKRRQFHMCPETSLEEYETCKMICEELKSMGLDPKVIHGTGVMAEIGAEKKDKGIIVLRADIDALDVFEETGAEFSSKIPGKMHACGHDAHIAMNLTAARIAIDLQDKIPGCIRVIFEPGEENAKGALGMIADGAMEGATAVYGTHVWSTIPTGKFSTQAGPRMASADFFTITVKGTAVHGSSPENGSDSICAAAAIISNIQVAFTREFPALEPTVVSFCQIHGGNTDNAIPEVVTIGGTTRSFNNDIRLQFPSLMERVIKNTAEAFKVEAELDYRMGSSSVHNNEKASKVAAKAVAKNFGEDALIDFPPVMGGENFSEYQYLAPGVFVFLGVRNEEIGAIYPQHSNHYTIDESVLINGAINAVQFAYDYLTEEV